MRLLLDEHYPAAIAEALRARGHDAVAVVERDDLRGLSDPALLVAAAAERRALASEDFGGFRHLVARAFAEGQPCFGVVCVDHRRLPRARPWPIVSALDALHRRLPGDEDLVRRYGGEVWL